MERVTTALAARTSRRSFLGKVGKTLVALAGGQFVALGMGSERAEAFHL
jgi:hypothetical protein